MKMVQQKTRRLSMILAIALALALILGCLFMLDFKAYADGGPSDAGGGSEGGDPGASAGNSIYYFTDSEESYIPLSNLAGFGPYEARCFTRGTWNTILANPYMYELFDSRKPSKLLDSDGAVDNYNKVSSIIIIELHYYRADGNALKALFKDLKGNRHRTMFITGYSYADYAVTSTDSFKNYVDEYIYAGNIDEFVHTTLDRIHVINNTFDGIRLLFAMEFFNGYHMSMTIDELYSSNVVFKSWIDFMASFYGQIIVAEDGQEQYTAEMFLTEHGIDFYLYDELGDIYDIAAGDTVTIDYDTIDNSYEEDHPFYAISVNTMSSAFYSYLKGYQEGRIQSWFEYCNEEVNKLRIYINGEMPYDSNGLVCETVGVSNSVDVDTPDDAIAALYRLMVEA